MTPADVDRICECINAVKVTGDWLLFGVLFACGLALWRIALLGKNSRDLWS